MADEGNDWAHSPLRTLVLKTNPYFPFRYINRWPYALALKRMVATVRDYPEVRALYLRHGLTSGDWTPGLSDIDQSVILERGLTAPQEFEVVSSLRAGYRRLRRFFPMVSEPEIFGADDLNAWLGATSQAPAPRSWILLHGTPVVDAAYDRSSNWPSHALRVALWVYLDILPPCLGKPDSHLGRANILRRVKKIERALRPLWAQSGDAHLRIDAHTPVPLLVAHAAKWLESAVARVEGGASSGAHSPTDSNSGIATMHGAVLFRGNLVVALRNGLEPDVIATLMAGRKWDRPPLPLAESVFRYVVRKYDPYSYAVLLRSREIILGADPMEGVPPPGRAECAAYLLRHLGHILAFTRGPELFSASRSLDVRDFERAMTRLMGIRLLVEKGWVTADWREIAAKWRVEFPECARALDGIRLAATRRPRSAHQEAFALFRSLASQVRDAITAVEAQA